MSVKVSFAFINTPNFLSSIKDAVQGSIADELEKIGIVVEPEAIEFSFATYTGTEKKCTMVFSREGIFHVSSYEQIETAIMTAVSQFAPPGVDLKASIML
jgi:hypothetical protein